MTLLYTDPLFLRHNTGHHVEVADRLRSITRQLEKAGLLQACPLGTIQLLDTKAVQAVHHPAQIEIVREAAEYAGDALQRLDPDTVVSLDSFQVALAAAGTGCAAVDEVMAGRATNALCLVRPPGHHATPTRSMGFCLFNNVALAARRALDHHGLDRILILDWDVHHGNGTQAVFYQEPRVFFLSVHRYGYGFYPGTGARAETGTGQGLGSTLNVPLAYGISREEYFAAYSASLEKAADAIRPQLVLLSAGFDAHARDPIGSLGLETEDFSRMTRLALEVARTHAQGRLVSCLEGGYHLDALAESVQAHLETLRANS